MADPAFQLIGSLVASGWYGESYGDTPYGGTSPLPFSFVPHVPSDNLEGEGRRPVAGTRHERFGLRIGGRKWYQGALWHVAQMAIDEATLEAFAVYYSAQKFLLLPTGLGGAQRTVYWVQDRFDYSSLRGGYYNLEFDIQEKP